MILHLPIVLIKRTVLRGIQATIDSLPLVSMTGDYSPSRFTMVAIQEQKGQTFFD